MKVVASAGLPLLKLALVLRVHSAKPNSTNQHTDKILRQRQMVITARTIHHCRNKKHPAMISHRTLLGAGLATGLLSAMPGITWIAPRTTPDPAPGRIEVASQAKNEVRQRAGSLKHLKGCPADETVS